MSLYPAIITVGTYCYNLPVLFWYSMMYSIKGEFPLKGLDQTSTTCRLLVSTRDKLAGASGGSVGQQVNIY